MIFLIEKKQCISRVSIIDTLLIEQINLFIQEQTKLDSTFMQEGYLSLSQKKIKYKGKDSNKMCFHIGESYYYFDMDERTNSFPLYYTEIGSKVILLELNTERTEPEGRSILSINYQLDEKCKKKFIKMINKTLPRRKMEIMMGRRVLFTPERIVIDGGKVFCL